MQQWWCKSYESERDFKSHSDYMVCRGVSHLRQSKGNVFNFSLMLLK